MGDPIDEALESAPRSTTPTDRETLLLELRGIAALLAEKAKALRDIERAENFPLADPDDATFPVVVETGYCLWEVAEMATSALTSVKAMLRSKALGELQGGTGSKEFTGSGGARCQVTVLPPIIRLRPDADLQKIKATLKDRYSMFFDEVTTVKPRKGFEELAVEDPTTTGLLTQAVTVEEATPRVTFKR